MNRAQLKAMVDSLYHAHNHHNELARRREVERLRSRDDTSSERDKHSTVAAMSLVMAQAYEAALAVTPKDTE